MSDTASNGRRERVARVLHVLDCELDAPEDEDSSLYAGWWESGQCNRPDYLERADRILAALVGETGEPVAWEVVFYCDHAGTRTRCVNVTMFPDEENFGLAIDGKVTEISREPLYAHSKGDSTR